MREPEYEDRFFELIKRAEDAKYSPETGPWLEEAYRLADERQDPEFGLLARYFYIFAIAPLEPHQAVVAFAWVTANEEHASPIIPMHWIVHLYGLVGGILRSYPNYSLEQIATTFDRMEAKFRELGLPLRDVYHHRIYEALGTGQRDAGRIWYDKWDATDRPSTACPVCDLGTRVIYHLFYEEYDEGFRFAQPIWDGLRCEEGQPLMAASASLIPLLRRHDWDRAAQCFQMSVAELKTISYAGIWSAGRQLGYLVSVGELDDAVTSFNRYFSTAWSSGTPADRFGYLLSAHMLGRRVAEEGREVSLRVPADCGLWNERGVYGGERIASFFEQEHEALMRRFDERNRNSEFERIVNLTMEIYEDTRAQMR